MILCPSCRSQVSIDRGVSACSHCGWSCPEKKGIYHLIHDSPQDEKFFPEHAFEILYNSEEQNFWFRVRNTIIGETIIHYLSTDSRILEVGCGTGFVSRYLKSLGYHVECADLFLDALIFCKNRNAGERYYQINLLEKVFVEEFDGICAFDVLEHIDDDVSVLKNIHAALKPNGILFVTVPADKRLWSAMDVHAEHKRRYSAPELQMKMECNGFKVIKMSYFMTLLYPFILLSRSISFRKGKMHDNYTQDQINQEAQRELNPGLFLNGIFFCIFRMEVPMIRAFTLPFGSSLLCVAVKETL